MNFDRIGRDASYPQMSEGGALSRRTRQWLILLGVVAALLVLGVGTYLVRDRWHAGQTGQASSQLPAPSASMSQPLMPVTLPTPDQLRPISPEEAAEANAKRPFSDRPDSPASRFVISTDAISRLRAVDCLGQAIYYEAASEGVDGGRAVAQVVLNRVRHPAFPSSVCGVVYQGSERVTGCQFSFTCDGSLARVPVAYLWARSLRIAQEALAGRVEASVGHATFYHADYVLPYWADSFDKVVKIGRHIFYRFRGGLGEARTFSDRYAGMEPPPPAPPSLAIPTTGADLVLPTPPETTPNPVEPVEADRVTPLAKAVLPPKEKNSDLVADLSRGELVIAGPTIASKPGRKGSEAAACDGHGNKVKAVSANDLRATTPATGCR